MLMTEERDTTDRLAAEARTAELLRTVEQHQAALDASAIVATTDARGIIVYANDNFCEISGYRREELIGQSHAIINSGSHSTQFWKDMWRTISGGRIWRGEICNRAKNGSLYWVDTTIVPFTDGSGTITQYVAVRTDITQRKHAGRALRHTTARFSLAVRGSSDGLWHWHMQTNSVYYSQRFKELLGYEDDEFANDYSSLQSHLHPDDVQPTNEAIQAHLHSVVPFDVRCRLRLKTSEWRWFRLRGQAVRRPRQPVQRMAGSITDIHDAVATQQQLETYAYELRRSNQELEQFAYIASHDLREPLRMVQSFCGLLKDRYQSQLHARAIKYIDFAVEGAARMQRLVEDLLEFSRVGRCNECNDRVRLTDVVQDALTNLHAAIQESGATIQVAALPCMYGDAGRLCQLFQNLIANALKFRRSEPLVVRIEARHESNHWVVSVSDNGIGIDPKHFDRLFVVFQRLHTREEYEGTGIGLALCKRIAELHGGRIGVLSTLGQGTTFELELPDEKVLSATDPWEETSCVPQLTAT